MSEKVGLSVVIPVYFNEGSLWNTTKELQAEVFDRHPELTPELVFVDDGSGDGSLAELLAIRDAHPNLVRILKLTRNFGQPSARLAGLRACRGELIVSMSADGQDPASLVHQMIEAHRDNGVQIVVCTREGRDESAYRVWTSAVFYALMRRLSFPNMPSGGFDYVLLTRRVLNVVLDNQDATPFFQGQLLWTGFPVQFIPYRRRARQVGRSRWTFGKKLTLLIDAVLGYSFAPIRLISAVGLAFGAAGALVALGLVVRYLLFGSEVQGWSTLVVLMLLIGGLQTSMLGMIGECLWRALAQGRDRAPYVIDQTWDREDA